MKTEITHRLDETDPPSISPERLYEVLSLLGRGALTISLKTILEQGVDRYAPSPDAEPGDVLGIKAIRKMRGASPFTREDVETISQFLRRLISHHRIDAEALREKAETDAEHGIARMLLEANAHATDILSRWHEGITGAMADGMRIT